MAIITIFGLAGTGTSSCGKMLAEKLNYEFISTGNLFRELACEMGMDLYEYEKVVNQNPDEDIKFDQKIIKIGKERDNLVIDSRLAWHFIPQSKKVKFICDDKLRIERIAKRDGMTFEEKKKKTDFRENSHMERYKKTYGLDDYSADTHFDLIIDTTDKNQAEIVDIIIKSYKLQV